MKLSVRTIAWLEEAPVANWRRFSATLEALAERSNQGNQPAHDIKTLFNEQLDKRGARRAELDTFAKTTINAGAPGAGKSAPEKEYVVDFDEIVKWVAKQLNTSVPLYILGDYKPFRSYISKIVMGMVTSFCRINRDFTICTCGRTLKFPLLVEKLRPEGRITIVWHFLPNYKFWKEKQQEREESGAPNARPSDKHTFYKLKKESTTGRMLVSKYVTESMIAELLWRVWDQSVEDANGRFNRPFMQPSSSGAPLPLIPDRDAVRRVVEASKTLARSPWAGCKPSKARQKEIEAEKEAIGLQNAARKLSHSIFPCRLIPKNRTITQTRD